MHLLPTWLLLNCDGCIASIFCLMLNNCLILSYCINLMYFTFDISIYLFYMICIPYLVFVYQIYQSISACSFVFIHKFNLKLYPWFHNIVFLLHSQQIQFVLLIDILNKCCWTIDTVMLYWKF